MADPVDLTTYTDTELDDLQQQIIAEKARRQVLATAQDQAESLAAQYNAAQGTVAWADDGTVYAPGATVTYNGQTWVNNSGAWLNGSYVPGDAEHPFWSQQPDPGQTPTPWATGMPLTQGEYVSNGGHVYQWAQADVASAPANYEPTGTVSTAAWTFIS